MIPATDPRWDALPARVLTPAQANTRVNIRALPSTSAAIVGQIQPDVPLTVRVIARDALTDTERAASADGDTFWQPIRLEAANVGWVRDDVVTLADVVETPQPPQEPDDMARRKFATEQLALMNWHLQEAYNISAVLKSLWEELPDNAA